MSTIRRLLLLPALVTALVAGPVGMMHADASFGNSVALAPMKIASGTVAAPGNVTGSLDCDRYTATIAASWTASTSPEVSGYLVTAYFSMGHTETFQLAPSATSWSAPILTFVALQRVRYSVMTQTSYGWTAESAKTRWFRC
jgi:hypothetical protein